MGTPALHSRAYLEKGIVNDSIFRGAQLIGFDSFRLRAAGKHGKKMHASTGSRKPCPDNLDPRRNCHDASQRFSRSATGGICYEIGLERVLRKLRRQ